jgi:hypothetical protein
MKAKANGHKGRVELGEYIVADSEICVLQLATFGLFDQRGRSVDAGEFEGHLFE